MKLNLDIYMRKIFYSQICLNFIRPPCIPKYKPILTNRLFCALRWSHNMTLKCLEDKLSFRVH